MMRIVVRHYCTNVDTQTMLVKDQLGKERHTCSGDTASGIHVDPSKADTSTDTQTVLVKGARVSWGFIQRDYRGSSLCDTA